MDNFFYILYAYNKVHFKSVYFMRRFYFANDEPDVLFFFRLVRCSRPVKMASQQQQPGVPMSQPGLQQSASLQQQQQQQQLSQQQDFDPVHRFKMLIPQLKESLQVIVKI